MNDEREPEEVAASVVLDELARRPGAEHGEDTAPVPHGVESEEVEVLHRIYLESVGLLAYELEPVAPRPGARARLLQAVAGDDTQDVSFLLDLEAPEPSSSTPLYISEPELPAPPAPTAPNAPIPVAEPPLKRPAEPAPAVRRASAEPRFPAVREEGPVAPMSYREAASRSRPRRWPVALAALFALAAIGLGVWAAMLVSEVDYRDARIRKLEADLAASSEKDRQLAEARLELARLEKRYDFVTAPSTTVFALRPPAAPGSPAPQPMARAHVFLAANHQDWRLEVRGLKPEAESQDYQLWLIIDGKPVGAGVFDVRAGEVASLSGGTMPGGVSALAVTLERKGGAPAPTTPILLLADTTTGVQI